MLCNTWETLRQCSAADEESRPRCCCIPPAYQPRSHSCTYQQILQYSQISHFRSRHNNHVLISTGTSLSVIRQCTQVCCKGDVGFCMQANVMVRHSIFSQMRHYVNCCLQAGWEDVHLLWACLLTFHTPVGGGLS